MDKLLKFILIIQLLGWFSSIIAKLYSQPVGLVIALLINILVWFALWKGTNFIVNNPEDSTVNKKANIIRWILSFFFSIFTLEVGLLTSFILRFFIDTAYVGGNSIVVGLVSNLGPWFSNLIIILGLLIALPILNLIAKSLKFKKPAYCAVSLTLLWAFLILVVGPILMP